MNAKEKTKRRRLRKRASRLLNKMRAAGSCEVIDANVKAAERLVTEGRAHWSRSRVGGRLILPVRHEPKRNTIICGDCIAVMRTFPNDYFHSIVCDPPYELGFMGKHWDATGIAYNEKVWAEARRILKPGGHLLAFGGTRTYHRMACAIEAAGFEIRDMLQWLYGGGFPKGLNISKAFDKAAGKEGKVISSRKVPDIRGGAWGANNPKRKKGATVLHKERAPATDEAKQWFGWNTALRPANEPICSARKPLGAKTIVENVRVPGTGAIFVEGNRIPSERIRVSPKKLPKGLVLGERSKAKSLILPGHNKYHGGMVFDRNPEDTYPSNVIVDSVAATMLEGVPRFFFCPKVGHGERNAGLEGLPLSDSHARYNLGYGPGGKRPTKEENHHPTVKPLALMRWLVRLVTPKGGLLLDPFCGSGSTCMAAKAEGMDYVGIDLEKEYCEISRLRIRATETGLVSGRRR